VPAAHPTDGSQLHRGRVVWQSIRATLGHAFPLESSGAGLSARPLLGYVAAVAVAWVLVLLRQAGIPALDTIWAEDGAVFLADAVNRPFREVVLEPYAGYALLVPRLLAEVASHLPLEFASAAMSGGSAFVHALLAAFVYRATSCLHHRLVRIALASAVILLPVMAREALNNAANLHWALMFAAFWALLWVPSRWELRLIASTVVGLAGLTDPLTLLLAPAAVMRLVAVGGWRDHVVTFAWGSALAVQLAVVANAAPVEPSGAEASIIDLAAAYGARVVSINMTGLKLSEWLWPAAGGLLPVVGLAVGFLLAIYSATRPAFPIQPVALLAIAVSLLMFGVTQSVRWGDSMSAAATWTMWLHGSRYLIVPTLLLLSAGALVLDRRDPRVPAAGWKRLRAGVLAWYVAVVAMSFSIPNDREAGPPWQDALVAARATCSSAGAPEVNVPITPTGWSATIRCEMLSR
jgi:hypothetical protein